MTSRTLTVNHFFDGGWATDFSPIVDIALSQDLRFRIPFLVDAENIIYELDGAPRKMPGTTHLNGAALESGAKIRGLFDFWLTGTAGSPIQHRIVHVGAKIKKDDADGSFSDIFTGLQTNSVPNYSVFDDLLIIAMDGSDVPKSWDGTIAQNLAGTPPNFAFTEVHKGRVWASGEDLNASTVYFSAAFDPEDWTGVDSGFIQVDPDDGDRIMAIASHKGDLWIFKGPHKGSIHRISGSAPTGSDPFALTVFKRGVGAAGPNVIFQFGNDLGFLDFDGTIKSLESTDRFADVDEASLSRSINREFIDKRVNFSELKRSWAAADNAQGVALINIPIDGSNDPNAVILMDFRFAPPRLAFWPGLSPMATALALVVDSASSNRRIIFSGTIDGFVDKLFQETRTFSDGTAIAEKATTPFLNYGAGQNTKTLSNVGLAFEPKNNGDILLRWTRDARPQQEAAINQSSSAAVLGGAPANQFILDTSPLGGPVHAERFSDESEGGEFRSIQYQIFNEVIGEDVEVHSMFSTFSIDGKVLENI